MPELRLSESASWKLAPGSHSAIAASRSQIPTPKFSRQRRVATPRKIEPIVDAAQCAP